MKGTQIAPEPSFSIVLTVMTVPPNVREEVSVTLEAPFASVAVWPALIYPSVVDQLRAFPAIGSP
jgi:hypothetical protein